MDIVKQECRNCRFSVVSETGAICRRFPPTPILIPAQRSTLGESIPASVTGYYSLIATEGWCGEWAATEPVEIQ